MLLELLCHSGDCVAPWWIMGNHWARAMVGPPSTTLQCRKEPARCAVACRRPRLPWHLVEENTSGQGPHGSGTWHGSYELVCPEELQQDIARGNATFATADVFRHRVLQAGNITVVTKRIVVR